MCMWSKLMPEHPVSRHPIPSAGLYAATVARHARSTTGKMEMRFEYGAARYVAQAGHREDKTWSTRPRTGQPARPLAGRDGRRRPQRLHRRGAPPGDAARRPDRAGCRRAVGRSRERRRLGGRDRPRARPQPMPTGATMARAEAARPDGIEAVVDRHAEPPARADRDGLPRGRHRRDLRQAAVDDARRGRGAGRADRERGGGKLPRDAQQHRLRDGPAGARDGRGRRARTASSPSMPPTSRTG